VKNVFSEIIFANLTNNRKITSPSKILKNINNTLTNRHLLIGKMWYHENEI